MVAGNLGKLLEGDKLLKPIRVGTKEEDFYSKILPNNFPSLLPFVPKYYGLVTRNDKQYVCLENVWGKHEKVAQMDLKVGKPFLQEPLTRTGVANLFGCYISGVECTGVSYRNRVNGYKGKDSSLQNFDRVLRMFLRRMGRQDHVIQRLHDLLEVIQRDGHGFEFWSSSLLLTFDDAKAPGADVNANILLIDFERIEMKDPSTSPDSFGLDVHLLRSLRHILYIMRDEWVGTVPTVYLVRHGERYDYTDPEWAPHATHPHDAPLSARGDTQAEDIADRLAIARPYMIVSSPFQRAVLTGEPTAEFHNQKICIEPGITEFMCNMTRTRVPNFISEKLTVSPWVDTEYKPFWPKIELEEWDTMCHRIRETVRYLTQVCKGKGDLIIVSHRYTFSPATIAHSSLDLVSLEFIMRSLMTQREIWRG